MLGTVLSRLMFSSICSVLVAIVIGGVIGLPVRTISGQNKRTILPAIVGAFFGTMLIAMLPISSKPGLSGGGGLGVLTLIAMAIVLVPPGAVGGAIAGIICGDKLSQKRQKEVFVVMLVVTYSVIAISIYTRFTLYCNSETWRTQICQPEAMLLDLFSRIG